MAITVDNKKVYDLITAKDALVQEGRKISVEIEKLEMKCKRFEEKEKRITGKVVPPVALTDEGNKIAKELEKMAARLDEIVKQINTFKLAGVPQQMKDDHMKTLKDKEALERERNKVALKIQKIKDKVVPIIQKEVKPLLTDPYDDIETAKLKDGMVVIETFNHVEDFKKKFRK
jgi:septation ring formation regulator EzrA